MLVRITAAVESSGFVDEPFGIESPPYAVDLGCDKDGRVVELRAEKRVDASSIRIPRRSLTGEGQLEFDIRLDDPELTDLLGLVQYLESIGSFHFGIQRIHWFQAKYEWIPETPEEQGLLTVRASTTRLGYPETIRRIRPEILNNAIAARDRLDHLTIPLAFFREGMNEYRALRYVTAFHNLYFFLEGLFGGGKTNNKQVRDQFMKSPTAMNAVAKAMAVLDAPDTQRHKARVLGWQKSRGFTWTPEGVLELVIWMRGNLHHFSLKGSTPKGHPLNHREFESIAFLVQAMALNVVAEIAR